MTKNYPVSPESLPAKQLKHAARYFATLLVTILLAGIAPAKLFAKTPAIWFFRPASGPVGTLVTINGTGLYKPTTITIGGQNATVVSNTGDVLVAMVMPGAATGAVSITTEGGTASGSGNFIVTATKFHSVQQGAKLAGTGNTGPAAQGVSVAVSADGNTAIVGGTIDNSNIGAAWVYIRKHGSWTQQGSKLVGTGAVGAASQGSSVALSADGNTAIIGGAGDNNSAGAAWVFVRCGGAWSQQGQKLVGTDATGAAGQGSSVSISADGNTAIVGGTGDNSDVGAAWVFTRSGNAWAQQGSKLAGTGYADVELAGCSVALSADGNTAIVGGSQSNFGNGAAWVFARSSGAWKQQGAMVAGKQSAFGTSVCLSADGNTAVIGAPGQGALDPNQGGLWVYIRSGGAWAQQGSKLTETGSVGRSPQLGWTVSVSADGNTAIAAGYSDNAHNGAAWIFTRSGDAWAQEGQKLVGTGNIGAAFQGYSVAISADGSTAISGAPDDNSDLGAAWAFVVAPPNDALLSTIVLSPDSTLTKTGTKGATTTYITSVSDSTASVTVTPTTQSPSASVKVNGTTVVSGTASASIPLVVGANTITTIVTAEDGVTTRTYKIIVIRKPSSNAYLSHISISSGTLIPVTGSPNYTVAVSNVTLSVTITPTTSDPNATVKVNGTTVTSGIASAPILLNVGANAINIAVTAQDGVTTQPYVITVNRAKSSNDYLSHLAISSGALKPVTGSPNYTDAVTNATSSVTVTATTADPNATLIINGTTVISGTASAAIPLVVGSNSVNIVVMAQDGTTSQPYVITVTRATGPLMSLYMPVSVVQPAEHVNTENDGVIVHQGISPNGDGINDFLTIDRIIAYPDNKVTIMDRSGAIIFEAKGYNNISKVFDGHSGINGRMQQPGTYFYSLDYVADGQNKHKTGFILLKY